MKPYLEPNAPARPPAGTKDAPPSAAPGFGVARSVPRYDEDTLKRETPRLPTGDAERKAMPIASGVLDYFPDALAAVAELSKKGNDKHNPGEPLHWARGKSMDQADTILRHMIERGTVDTDGVRHSTKVAWRALAQLQIEIEGAKGLPISRGSKP